MSSEPPVPPSPPPPDPPTSPTIASVQRRAADRPPPARDPSKPPSVVPILGGISVIVAMLTLCAGGLRLVKPEGALGVDALGPIFEVSLARNAILFSMIVWLLMSLVL